MIDMEQTNDVSKGDAVVVAATHKKRIGGDL
jgi:hypothetical protein